MLPLVYTQKPFMKTSSDVLKNWRFIPAKLDGTLVPIQTELRFDYTLEGSVITTNNVNHFLFDRFDGVGDTAVIYRPASVAKLDKLPVRVAGDTPKYSTLAERDGVRGKVKVGFYIDEKGDVRMPAAIAGDVHLYLLEEAVEAVRTWKFEPTVSHGDPVLVAASQEFNFGGVKQGIFGSAQCAWRRPSQCGAGSLFSCDGGILAAPTWTSACCATRLPTERENALARSRK